MFLLTPQVWPFAALIWLIARRHGCGFWMSWKNHSGLVVINLGEPAGKRDKLAASLCTHVKNVGRNVCDRVWQRRCSERANKNDIWPRAC